MKSILVKKVPLYIFLIAIGFLSLIIYHVADTAPQARLEIQQAATPVIQNNQTIEQVRLSDYKLISPLLYSDVRSESESLDDLKTSVTGMIDQMKIGGKVNLTPKNHFIFRLFSKDPQPTAEHSERYLVLLP